MTGFTGRVQCIPFIVKPSKKICASKIFTWCKPIPICPKVLWFVVVDDVIQLRQHYFLDMVHCTRYINNLSNHIEFSKSLQSNLNKDSEKFPCRIWTCDFCESIQDRQKYSWEWCLKPSVKIWCHLHCALMYIKVQL